MNSFLSKYLLISSLLVLSTCSRAQPGHRDPQALNDDPRASEEERSYAYQIPNAQAEWTLDLDGRISETSGLILWDGVLWTHNDDSDTRLYGLDPATAELVGEHLLPGVVNQDWEDLDQDDDFIYVGDFGNNRGNRENLHILRIQKNSLNSGTPSIDTIWFSFSDQLSFDSPGLNQTDFDCEALAATSDSIYLFTKQWLSGQTSQYVLPKEPGTHVARKRASYDVQGQVTGATILEEQKLLVLCGYAGFVQPFLHLFYDYRDDDFFSGIQQRINLGIPFHQVEAVHSSDGIHYFVSNERYSRESYVNIPPRLHLFDLGEFLEDHLKGGGEFD